MVMMTKMMVMMANLQSADNDATMTTAVQRAPGDSSWPARSAAASHGSIGALATKMSGMRVEQARRVRKARAEVSARIWKRMQTNWEMKMKMKSLSRESDESQGRNDDLITQDHI